VLVPPVGAVALVVGGCAAVAAAGLLIAWRNTGRTRGLALAVTAGTGYGLTAALLKIVGGELQGGWTAPLGHPALYAAVVVGGAAVLLSQNTLQSGRRAAPAIAVMMAVDPAVGLVTGVSWFGEQLTTSPPALVGALAATAAMVLGVTLAHPADHATDRPATGAEPRPEPAPPTRTAV